MCWTTASRSLRVSSGSWLVRSSSEDRRSAKSTVTCLRSPSIAEREVRIRSARWLGVYATGDAGRLGELPGTTWAVPHSTQNLADADGCAPHLGQLRRSG